MEAKMVYEGEGGGYYAWCPNEFEALWRHNVGAVKLFLSTNGLALPCYSDSPKVAYVLQGGGVAGVVLPGKEEKVVAIRKGDAIALPVGVVTWWYNKDATELEILFLGDTKTATKLGSFKDIFTGFLPEFVCRAWNLKESVLRTLIGPQLAKSIIKLDPGFEMLEPKQDQRDGMLLNCEEAASSTVRVRYVGGIIADRHIEAGELFVVPRLLKVLIITDPDGMEWFSIVTNEKPNHYFSLGFWGLLTEASIPMSSSSPGCS
ncbi:11S globulin seed storage protein Ana o 2.0101-like [Lycium barbarum]|uniref:11S globulin seed storage protein Ana o 2.0101-like n=1 Tax=Lycium barbarum TaxID=112863 RepID=UPI00293E6FB3|nr:11S globulin seed storage protein Ana o 2.0101-like [Lycium barbarum]